MLLLSLTRQGSKEMGLGNALAHVLLMGSCGIIRVLVRFSFLFSCYVLGQNGGDVRGCSAMQAFISRTSTWS